jgi:two-component system phosphate regulon response regulator OmpR
MLGAFAFTLRADARLRFQAWRDCVHQKRHVLVVEPDDSIRELLKRWLGEEGFGVIVCPHENLDARPVPGEAPSLVIANISSPRGAPDVLQAIRAVYAAPILLLSARFRRGLGASRDVARRLRVQGVLPKPFARAELLAAVRRSIEGSQ